MKLLRRILLVNLIVILITTSGCNQNSLLTKPAEQLKKVIVSYYGTGGRFERESAVQGNDNLANEFYRAVSQTNTEKHLNPNEMNVQESSPMFVVTFHYTDGSSDEIYSTETGKFVYRMISEKGWVGGRNDQVFGLITKLVGDDLFSFSLNLVKKPLPPNFRTVDFRKWEIEKRPILTQRDNAHLWDGRSLKVDRSILRDKLRGEVPTSGRPFVLIINGERVAWGEFWTALSSLSPPSDIPIIFFDIPTESGDVLLYDKGK